MPLDAQSPSRVRACVAVVLASPARYWRGGAIIDAIGVVPSVEKLIERMRIEPASLRFAELKKVCEHYFGTGRQSGSSHVIFKTPWPDDPRVNIQNDRGKAKVYQVRQVLAAIDKLEEETR